MGKLFIIGNGFDIAHELPTRYTDFYNHLVSTDQGRVFIENIERIICCDRNEFWNSFEKNLGDLNLDILLEEVMDEREDFNSQFDYGPLDENHITNHIVSSHISSLHKLDSFVSNWIKTIDLESVPINSIYQNIFTDESIFINFNYTKTLQHIYEIRNEKVFHVHGDVNNPIMGHGKDSSADMFSFDEVNDIAIKEFSEAIVGEINEFYNNSRKETNKFCNEMIDFINKIDCEIDEVCLIGHSLGLVDEKYFQELGYYYSDKPWTIIIRDPDDKNNKLKALKKINVQVDANLLTLNEYNNQKNLF